MDTLVDVVRPPTEDPTGSAFLVWNDAGKPRMVEFGETAVITVGRDPSCDCVLDDVSVEPVHCRVHWSGRLLTVEPVARAKTYRGGRLLEETMRLDPGDEMQVGRFELVVGVRQVQELRRQRALTHAELRERLVEELARAERAERTVAVVAVRSGFGQGARLTNRIGHLLRSGDMLGSYGPDELEIVLSDARAEDVLSIVDQIGRDRSLTTTAGYALSPDDGDEADVLLRAAHGALDIALREGAAVERVRSEPPRGHAPAAQDESSRELSNRITALCGAEANIVLVGEPGAGRATLAAYVHGHSGRPTAAFESVQAHDARASRSLVARVQRARGGTLCIRDVDAWPLDAQIMLREALATERSIRLVTTTTRALPALVAAGVVDPGLFERLDGVRVEVPPVRSRPNDLVAFAEHFAIQHGAATPVRFTLGAFARLHAYPWPGNLVELDDAMRRAVYLAAGGEILADHLPTEPLPADAAAGRLREHVDSVERDAIIRALADNNQNQTHAAKKLGLSRRALIYKMEKYGLKAPAGTVQRRSSVPARRSSKPVRVA